MTSTDFAQWIAIAFCAGACLFLALGQHELWHQARRLARRIGEEFKKHRNEDHENAGAS